MKIKIISTSIFIFLLIWLGYSFIKNDQKTNNYLSFTCNHSDCSSILSNLQVITREVQSTSLLEKMSPQLSCPENDKDWRPFLKQMLTNVNNPFESQDPLLERIAYQITSFVKQTKKSNQLLIQDVLNISKQCLKKRKSTFGQMCLSKLKSFSKVYENRGSLSIKEWDQNPEPQPFRLPKVFFNKSFIRLWKSNYHYDSETNEFTTNTSQDSIDNAINYLHKNLGPGTKTIQFNSATLPYKGMRSFTTFIPGDDYDLKVHYHLTSDYLVARIFKKDFYGYRLKKPRIEFHTFKATSSKKSNAHNTSRCVSCHRGSEPALIPIPGTIVSHAPDIEDPQDLLDWVNNERVIKAGDTHLSYKHLAPPIGPSESPWRTSEFMDRCTQKITPTLNERDKFIVSNSMKCTGCHVQEGLGLKHLKFPLHTLDFKNQILDNLILSGHMPTKSKFPLNQPMRQALLSCLKYEYFGGFKDSDLNQGNQEPGILINYLIPDKCN